MAMLRWYGVANPSTPAAGTTVIRRRGKRRRIKMRRRRSPGRNCWFGVE
jgi:hypothetical protein